MPKTKSRKEELIKIYEEKLDNQKSVAIANFSGLTVKEIENLRKKCRENKIEYFVAKKNLLSLALKAKGLENSEIVKIEENIGIAFGEDEIGPARIFKEYKKDHNDKFNIIAGILENRIIRSDEVLALANLPTKEELLAKVVGSIQAPISGFVNVLQGNFRGLVNVLNGIKESI